MTEPHRAEAERERLLSELQARNAEMENFVYTVSHDLKNPLITIGGFASLLDRDIAAGKLKQARDSIGEINRAVATLKQHIEDVLALSRAGRVIAEQRPVRLAELVAAVLAPMRERIAALDATVVVAPDLPQVLVNEEGFHRVYTNLIDNAVKYRRAGAAPRIDIGWRRDGAQLRLYVRDNGIGIEPQYRERVFGLFQRLDTHTEGTGVGLAISRRVVEAHGGGMWVESEYGRGSTFWLSLPESVIVRAAVHPNGLDANTG
jgi:signal transduction histidine kinase